MDLVDGLRLLTIREGSSERPLLCGRIAEST